MSAFTMMRATSSRRTSTRARSKSREESCLKVVFGDPSKAGFYTILLFVPAHTTIQAHSHRDDRVAVVVLGEWHLGYGTHFDAKSLKTLPPGSVYSEPGGDNHFAQTDTEAVVVEISGYGPTDTKYFDPANEPKSQEKK
jgi:quercetin dioxygenase-like cupin family protein